MNFKLYKVSVKDKDGHLKFALEEGKDPKEYLRPLNYLDIDLRTVKEIPFPEGEFRAGDLDNMYYIFFDGELMLSWSDEANVNYPEDLTWSGYISGLVDDAIKLGMRIASKKNEELYE